jgi:hypothetical protein
MRKPGTDPDNVQMSDVLCDFCRTEWTQDLPVIEGHQGSIICGGCLSAAYRAVFLDKQPTAAPGDRCTMCLETRADAGWASPGYPGVCVCKRCINQAAAALSKDKDYHWRKPT